MGRCTVFEGLQQEAELGLRLLGRDADGLKNPLLKVSLMNPDTASTDLETIQNQVVGPRPDFQRFIRQLVQIIRVRTGEGVVTRCRTATFFILVKEGKFLDPTELQIICLLYTSPSPRDGLLSRMPSSA